MCIIYGVDSKIIGLDIVLLNNVSMLDISRFGINCLSNVFISIGIGYTIWYLRYYRDIISISIDIGDSYGRLCINNLSNVSIIVSIVVINILSNVFINCFVCYY